MRILKFGGKSLDSYEKVQKVCDFIQKVYKNDKKIVVIVSAMGDTTNRLCSLSRLYSSSNAIQREQALFISTGETQSAALVAMMLQSLKIPAKSLSASDIDLATFGDYANSRVAYINKSKLSALLDKNIVAVVCGFQGVNHCGDITLLGRGGSDTTATAIACAYGENAEIFSDYDGIFAGDPRLLPFKKLEKIDYDTTLSMSKSGAKVLDERAVNLAKKFNVKIISKASSSPESRGTEISNIGEDVITITASEELKKISVCFTSPSRMEQISKIILRELTSVKFYDLKICESKISFLVPSSNYLDILRSISQKLKLKKEQA